jgi:hypothetical protein
MIKYERKGTSQKGVFLLHMTPSTVAYAHELAQCMIRQGMALAKRNPASDA